MKNFLTITSITEGTTGIILLLFPQFIVQLLLSTPLEGLAGIIVARVAGIAILFLAINCWFSKNDVNNIGILYSLLFYNLAITFIFIYESFANGLSNIFLWLVVFAHLGLVLWEILLIKKIRTLSNN